MQANVKLGGAKQGSSLFFLLFLGMSLLTVIVITVTKIQNFNEASSHAHIYAHTQTLRA